MAVYCRINGVVASVMESAGRFAKVYRRDSGLRLAFGGGRADFHRDLLDDADPKAFERSNASRMVREQADTGDIQVRKYLRADTDLALRAALMVGQSRLTTFVVKENGFLVANVLDGESLGTLVEIDNGSTAFLGDHLHGTVDGGMAFA